MSERAAALQAADAGARLAAIAAIDAHASLDAEDQRALIDCLGFDAKAVQRKAAELCASLMASAAPLRPLLLEALRGPNPRLRWGAAFALAKAEECPREVLPAALEALGSDDGDVRWAAAEIIERLGRHDAGVADQLLACLENRQSPGRRKMALYCLREIERDAESVRRAAARALEDNDEGVALAALAACVRLAPEDEDIVSGTLKLLRSDNPRLRRAAAQALGQIGLYRPEVDEALRAASNRKDESLRRVAKGTLKKRQSAAANPELKTPP